MASERVRWVGLYFCMLLFSLSKAFHRPSARLNLQPHLSRSPTNSRLSNGVVLSALKLPEKKKEMSDLDRDILKELLEDQNFLQTLSNQNQTVSNSLREEIMKKPKKSKSSFPGINSDENADFQSETFKKAEEFQQVLGSLWGGFAAAFESAAIFVANKVAEDIKVTLFMGQRVLFDTRRTLAAGKDAPPGPARLLAAAARGAQARNLTAAEATQLLRSGALRLEDLGSQDRRLGSVRGSKVARARNKKVQKKGAPLPLRAAAALPELTGRAADLAYEVNREIKYEEAGRKVEKYANLLGVDASFLLGPEAAAKALRAGGGAGRGGKALPAVRAVRGEARGLRPVAQDGREGGGVGTAAAAAGFLEAEAPAPKLVTTYGELLELLNGVKPELAAYEEINKLGGVICSDLEAMCEVMATSIKKDKDIVKDMQEVCQEMEQESVRAPLLEGIELKQLFIQDKVEWVEECQSLVKSFIQWEELLLEMSADFRGSARVLAGRDAALFDARARADAPLPREAEQYVDLLTERLRGQRAAQADLAEASNKVLSFLRVLGALETGEATVAEAQRLAASGLGDSLRRAAAAAAAAETALFPLEPLPAAAADPGAAEAAAALLLEEIEAELREVESRQQGGGAAAPLGSPPAAAGAGAAAAPVVEGEGGGGGGDLAAAAGRFALQAAGAALQMGAEGARRAAAAAAAAAASAAAKDKESEGLRKGGSAATAVPLPLPPLSVGNAAEVGDVDERAAALLARAIEGNQRLQQGGQKEQSQKLTEHPLPVAGSQTTKAPKPTVDSFQNIAISSDEVATVIEPEDSWSSKGIEERATELTQKFRPFNDFAVESTATVVGAEKTGGGAPSIPTFIEAQSPAPEVASFKNIRQTPPNPMQDPVVDAFDFTDAATSSGSLRRPAAAAEAGAGAAAEETEVTVEAEVVVEAGPPGQQRAAWGRGRAGASSAAAAADGGRRVAFGDLRSAAADRSDAVGLVMAKGAPPSASPGGGLGLRVAGGGGGGGEGLDIDVEGEAAPTEEAAARRAALKTLDVLILLLERLLTAGVPALTEVVEVAGSRAAAALGGPTGRGGGWEPLGGLRTRRRPSPPPSSSSQQQGG